MEQNNITIDTHEYEQPICEVIDLSDLGESIMAFGGSDGGNIIFSNEDTFDDEDDDWNSWDTEWEI